MSLWEPVNRETPFRHHATRAVEKLGELKQALQTSLSRTAAMRNACGDESPSDLDRYQPAAWLSRSRLTDCRRTLDQSDMPDIQMDPDLPELVAAHWMDTLH